MAYLFFNIPTGNCVFSSFSETINAINLDFDTLFTAALHQHQFLVFF